MASTLFYLHNRSSSSPSPPQPEPFPTTQILAKNLITYYRCGHSHTSTSCATVQTQNLGRWSRLSTWTTSMQTTITNDPSSCPHCKKRLASELRQAAQRQNVIRLNAERASWREGRRNPAPPTRGVEETIDAVLSLGHEESVERLRRVQEDVLRGKSPMFALEGQHSGQEDEPNPWERQEFLGRVAQKKLDVVARIASNDSIGSEHGVLSQRPRTTTIITRGSWGLTAWSLASIDEEHESSEQAQASPSRHKDHTFPTDADRDITSDVHQTIATTTELKTAAHLNDRKNPNSTSQTPRTTTSTSLPIFEDEDDLTDFKLIYTPLAAPEEDSQPNWSEVLDDVVDSEDADLYAETLSPIAVSFERRESGEIHPVCYDYSPQWSTDASNSTSTSTSSRLSWAADEVAEERLQVERAAKPESAKANPNTEVIAQTEEEPRFLPDDPTAQAPRAGRPQPQNYSYPSFSLLTTPTIFYSRPATPPSPSLISISSPAGRTIYSTITRYLSLPPDTPPQALIDLFSRGEKLDHGWTSDYTRFPRGRGEYARIRRSDIDVQRREEIDQLMRTLDWESVVEAGGEGEAEDELDSGAGRGDVSVFSDDSSDTGASEGDDEVTATERLPDDAGQVLVFRDVCEKVLVPEDDEGAASEQDEEEAARWESLERLR